MTELVHVKIDADIAWITLDSPHNRNALSRELTRELLAGLERCRSNDVRVVVLSGTGRGFCQNPRGVGVPKFSTTGGFWSDPRLGHLWSKL